MRVQVSGHRVDRHEKAYRQFFEVHETPKREITVKIREGCCARGKAAVWLLRAGQQRSQGPNRRAEHIQGKGHRGESLRKTQGATELQKASGILRGIPERQAVHRVRRADIPGIHQQEDAGTQSVQGLHDEKTAAGAGIHPKHLRARTGADCLRGPREAAQPLCGTGCHAAAMTFLVMR